VDARCEERGGTMSDQFADLLDESEIFYPWWLVERVMFLQDIGSFDEIGTFVTGKGVNFI
jgi:hypothetical protein